MMMKEMIRSPRLLTCMQMNAKLASATCSYESKQHKNRTNTSRASDHMERRGCQATSRIARVFLDRVLLVPRGWTRSPRESEVFALAHKHDQLQQVCGPPSPFRRQIAGAQTAHNIAPPKRCSCSTRCQFNPFASARSLYWPSRDLLASCRLLQHNRGSN